MVIPKKYYLWLVLGIVILIVVEYNKPQKINWQRTYSSFDNLPFGTKVLYDLLPDIFPGNDLERINKTFYDYQIRTFPENKSFIFINEHINFEEQSLKKLLSYVEEGNQLFISAKNIDKTFTDTLGVKLEKDYFYGNSKPHTLRLNETEALIDTISKIPTIYFKTSIELLDEAKYEVEILDSSMGFTNFVKIKYGEGQIFLHSEPLAFTNYYLLKGYSKNYCEEVFRQMRNTNIVWSDYPNNGLRMSLNPIQYILDIDAYRYSYYVLLILLILYIGLAGRRKQRVIPVIEPYVNSSVNFIQTISNLYLSNKNNKKIAQHRIKYLRNYLHTNYFIDWKLPEKEVVEKLGNKTGKGEEKVKNLLKYIKYIETKNNVTQQELLKLNTDIDLFILK